MATRRGSSDEFRGSGADRNGLRLTWHMWHQQTAMFLMTTLALMTAATPAAGTELPELLPAGRLAYSTAVYEADASGTGQSVHGLGTMRLDGTDQRTLTSPVRPAYDHSPDWSPDGRWLVAMRELAKPDSPTSTEIRIVSADGSHSEVVGHGTFPTWSPDGRTLAWSSKDPAKPGLVLLPVDITGDALVTDPSRLREVPTPRRALASAWSPLGGALAVWVDQEADDFQRDLWHVDVATGGLRHLAASIHQYHHSVRPAWHPAGLQLAVIAREAGGTGPTRAWLVASDGSGYSRLIDDDDPRDHVWVSWAPHGLSLALEAGGGALLVSPLGVVLRELGSDRLEAPETPVWSPNGTHVYVVADEESGDYKPELWALPVLGEDVRQLTTDSSVFPTTATAVDPGLALRIIGRSPADTAVAVADRLPDSSTVVLTTTASAPAATPLATALQASLLQTFTDSLPSATRGALQNRRPTTAWVIGQVSDAVETQLRDLGVTTVRRVGGSDESSVAAAVAEHLPATTVFLAPQEGSVEQSAAAAVAGARRQPLLLTGSGTLGASTRAALQRLDVTHVHLTTASSAVSASVDEELRDMGISVQRLSGTSPSQAALRLAEAFADTSSMSQPVVVPEDRPGIGGSMLAASRRTVLLPAGKEASDPVVQFVDAHSAAISSVDLMATPEDLTPVLETAVEGAAQGNTPPTPASSPTAPAEVSATAGNGSAVVSWSAAADGGSAITGYTVTSSPGGKTCATSGALSCTVLGLVNGTAHTFTVTASNAIGTSPSSPPSNTITPTADPTEPTEPTEPPPAGPTARTIDDACPVERVPADRFTDVITGSTHERAISCLVWWEVARGRTATSYAPADGVTRDAMAAFVARTILKAKPGSLPDNPVDAFGDDDGSVHHHAINQLAAVDIIRGTGDGKYSPSRVVTRGQMAKFLANAAAHVLSQPLPADRDLFADDNGNPFETDINRVAQAGLTGGRADGAYDSSGTVQRDQMGSFLARTLDLFVDNGATLPQ
jgi:Tol biopolymer transport system component